MGPGAGLQPGGPSDAHLLLGNRDPPLSSGPLFLTWDGLLVLTLGSCQHVPLGSHRFSGSVTAIWLLRKPRRWGTPQPAELAPLKESPNARVTQSHRGLGGGEGCQPGGAAPALPTDGQHL